MQKLTRFGVQGAIVKFICAMRYANLKAAHPLKDFEIHYVPRSANSYVHQLAKKKPQMYYMPNFHLLLLVIDGP